jgi:hypothetical protein
MTAHINTLKVQIPASRPIPPYASRIGEVFARFLSGVGDLMSHTNRASRPSVIRSELFNSAAHIETQRPGAALSLRWVAAKGWVY